MYQLGGELLCRWNGVKVLFLWNSTGRCQKCKRKIGVCKIRKAKMYPNCSNYFNVSDYMTKYLKNGKAFINQQAYFFSYIAFLYFQLQKNEKCFNCHLMEQVNSVYWYTTLLLIKFLSLKNVFCIHPCSLTFHLFSFNWQNGLKCWFRPRVMAHLHCTF